MSDKPAMTLTDGRLKATIWKNPKEGGGAFYSASFTRSFKEGDTWKDTTSFSGVDLLKISNLARRAYDCIGRLQGQDQLADAA